MAVGAAIGVVMLTVAGPAGAQEEGIRASGQAGPAVSVAQSDPMFFGMGLAGLLWLFVGLLALVVGVVLAARRARRPVTGSRSISVIATTTSNENTGGADK